MSKHTEPRIPRQSVTNRLVHWLIALSTFALFFSGFGQMPMYDRYGLSALPGMSWAGNYQITLAIHYLAGAVFVFAIVLHIVAALAMRTYDIVPRRGDLRESVVIIKAMMGRGETPASGKYLAEQRLAYAFIGGNILVIGLTGILKVVKNLPGVDINPLMLFVNTAFHNAAAMLLLLGIFAHLAAFAVKQNRALLPAMIDGTVDEHHAREHHSLWYEEVTRSAAGSSNTSAADPEPSEAVA
jgi:formate dehydrogenase gamma subunit